MKADKSSSPARTGEIVTMGPTTLATQQELPDYLKNTAGRGLEDMDRQDILLPRIAISQTLSPALKKNKPQFIPGLTVGQLYNTVTREIYGDQIHFVPVLFSKARIYFEDINKGGGILCQSLNALDGGALCPTCATCPKSRFVNNEAPECNLFMNYPGLVLKPAKDGKSYEVLGMAAVSMKSTALSVAKKWNSLMRLGNVAAYGRVYRVKVVEDSRDSNDFYNFDVMPLSFTPETIYRQAEAFHASLRAQGVKVDLEEIMGDTDFAPTQM